MSRTSRIANSFPHQAHATEDEESRVSDITWFRFSLEQGEGENMLPKPLHNAAQVLSTLVESGCQVRVEKDALVIHDPGRALTDNIREEIRKHKLAILTLLLRESLVHLVRVLDMAQPTIRMGMQEEYAAALLAAMRLVGNPWAGEDEETNFWEGEE